MKPVSSVAQGFSLYEFLPHKVPVIELKMSGNFKIEISGDIYWPDDHSQVLTTTQMIEFNHHTIPHTNPFIVVNIEHQFFFTFPPSIIDNCENHDLPHRPVCNLVIFRLLRILR